MDGGPRIGPAVPDLFGDQFYLRKIKYAAFIFRIKWIKSFEWDQAIFFKWRSLFRRRQAVLKASISLLMPINRIFSYFFDF